MTYKFQNRLLSLTSTIHAWSALEVFVISIIAALLELQQFAQFIVGNRCDLINKVLGMYGMNLTRIIVHIRRTNFLSQLASCCTVTINVSM